MAQAVPDPLPAVEFAALQAMQPAAPKQSRLCRHQARLHHMRIRCMLVERDCALMWNDIREFNFDQENKAGDGYYGKVATVTLEVLWDTEFSISSPPTPHEEPAAPSQMAPAAPFPVSGQQVTAMTAGLMLYCGCCQP